MDAARRLGVTESEEAFDKALRALLRLKPKPKGGNS
jgi:Arc/MetJ family transcription regulator